MITADILTLIGLLFSAAALVGASHQILHKRISALRDEIEGKYLQREIFELRLSHIDEKLNDIRSDIKQLLVVNHD